MIIRENLSFDVSDSSSMRSGLPKVLSAENQSKNASTTLRLPSMNASAT